MAAVVKRTWRSRGPTGHKVRKVAWGYTLQVNGQQERRYDAAWSRRDAEEALAKRLLERDAPPPPAKPKTLAELVTEYLDYKRAKGKRSIGQDEQIGEKLKRGFGAEAPVTEITAQRIAQYDRDRVTQTSRLGRPVTPSTVNRELAILRHMLRLAEEWGYITKVPKIRLSKEPEGRLRFLGEDEIERLLVASEDKRSKSPYLRLIVTMALNTGMRKGEILGLTWARVDLSRGVLLLEHTKSGRRREVPMNRAGSRLRARTRLARSVSVMTEPSGSGVLAKIVCSRSRLIPMPSTPTTPLASSRTGYAVTMVGLSDAGPVVSSLTTGRPEWTTAST